MKYQSTANHIVAFSSTLVNLGNIKPPVFSAQQVNMYLPRVVIFQPWVKIFTLNEYRTPSEVCLQSHVFYKPRILVRKFAVMLIKCRDTHNIYQESIQKKRAIPVYVSGLETKNRNSMGDNPFYSVLSLY